MAVICQGVRSPSALRITVTPTDPSLDLTTVTSVTLGVTMVTLGTTVTWTATPVGGATATLMQAIYVFAVNGLDCSELGKYDVSVTLVTPSGPVPGTAFDLLVLPANAFRTTG